MVPNAIDHLYCLLVSSLSFPLGNSTGFSPVINDHETYILNFQNGGAYKLVIRVSITLIKAV